MYLLHTKPNPKLEPSPVQNYVASAPVCCVPPKPAVPLLDAGQAASQASELSTIVGSYACFVGVGVAGGSFNYARWRGAASGGGVGGF